MRRTLLVSLATCVCAGAAQAASAAPVPRVVAEQLGVVRQVVVGDRHVAWTRCVTPTGPTEVWAAPVAGGKRRRVPGVRVAGPCEQVRIVGVFRERVVTLISGRAGLRRLDAIDIRTGQRALYEAETPAASGVRIVGADVEGPRVAWLREAGLGDQRSTSVVLADLRAPLGTGVFAGGTRKTLYTRTLLYGAVTPTGVWVGPDGRALVRESLTGAQYGYGAGGTRAILVGVPRPVTYARTAGGARLLAADLTSRVFAYTVVNPGTGQSWLYLRDRRTNSRRMLRRFPGLPASVPREVPAIPAPAAYGRFVTWRERARASGGFVDRVLAFDILRRRVTVMARVRDTRGQRAFLSAPSVRSSRVAWAEVTLSSAAGAAGGYYGVAPPGSRSRVLIARVR